MNQKNNKIRLEKSNEYRIVENLVREAFWNVYRPGCMEHYLLHELRNHNDYVKKLAFVMEKDEEIIGQITFMKAKIKADAGGEIPAMTIGPICIAPDYQRQRLGKELLDYGIEEAKKQGAKVLFLDGNIDFYGKSGFGYASEKGIRYYGVPEGEDVPFFLCKELEKGYLDGITGEYVTSSGYFVDESKVDEFDKEFPYKEKLKLPGQL